jgi:hypothetical protein
LGCSIGLDGTVLSEDLGFRVAIVLALVEVGGEPGELTCGDRHSSDKGFLGTSNSLPMGEFSCLTFQRNERSPKCSMHQ